jgi:trimeric autotransporter adhesin
LGSAVALAATGQIVAGAPFESGGGARLDGDPEDRSAPGAGAAYVFTRSGDTWVARHYVKATNTDADDVFGTAIACSRDGTVVAVGAPGEDALARGIDPGGNNNTARESGAVYIYE